MPEYLYKNPKTNETKTIFQTMSEPHEYEEDGIKWDRLWETPTFSTANKIDPFDKKKFVEKTGNMKGTYGNMMDYAKEMSEARKEKLGFDPVEKKYFEDYEKKVGKKHLRDTPKTFENDFVSISDVDNPNIDVED